MGKTKDGTRYQEELRARAVRMVLDHEDEYANRSAAILSISQKVGCSRDSLRIWAKQHETDTGKRDRMTTAERDRIKELERENRQLRQANEILKKASAYFAQAELVLCKSWLLRQKGAAAQHLKLRGCIDPAESAQVKLGRYRAAAGVASYRAWSVRTAIEFDDPRLFYGPERIGGLRAQTSRLARFFGSCEILISNVLLPNESIHTVLCLGICRVFASTCFLYRTSSCGIRTLRLWASRNRA